ncbi:MAG: amylo-alpha-1,6-glucosidase [Promethearchaeota archaeon]
MKLIKIKKINRNYQHMFMKKIKDKHQFIKQAGVIIICITLLIQILWGIKVGGYSLGMQVNSDNNHWSKHDQSITKHEEDFSQTNLLKQIGASGGEEINLTKYFFKRPTCNDIFIHANALSDKEFVYTNKKTAYYTGNTRKLNTRHWHGMVVRHTKYLENFYLKLGTTASELVLNKESFTDADIYPYKLVRYYDIGGVFQPQEEIFMPDNLDALGVKYHSGYSGQAIMYIQFDIHDIYFPSSNPYSYGWNSSNSYFWITRTGNEYMVFKTNITGLSFTTSEYWPSKTYTLDQARGEGGTASTFQPGYFSFNIPSNGTIYFAFAVANTSEEANLIADNLLANYSNLMKEKMDRMDDLLARTPINTENAELNKALNWAKISLDNLIMEQYVGGVPAGIGIWAGLHWFPESWARDLFISFPGATLCTGDFNDASEIISMMSNLQNTNSSDVTYGRIPNRILPGDPNPAYSSADGTPWFIREIYEYFQFTNNLTFLTNYWEVIQRAIDGVINKRTDSNHFIMHGPSLTGNLVETWMDGAVHIGANLVANSPRDNRAVEIQALWYTAIRIAAELANMTGHSDDAKNWNSFADVLKTNFQNVFFNKTINYLIDHLNEDGSEDHRIRPNQLFAISVPTIIMDDLIPIDEQLAVINIVEQKLHFPQGIATLNKDDVHNWGTEDVGYRGYDYGGMDESACFKDPNGHWVGNSWSYHNGMVWPWLSGPTITSYIKHNWIKQAYNLTTFLTDLLLNRGTLGSLCEILPGDENRPTGTTSQAWSLAEFIRVLYQDYLGFHPYALKNMVTIDPTVPDDLGNVSAVYKIADSFLNFTYSRDSYYDLLNNTYDNTTSSKITRTIIALNKNNDTSPSDILNNLTYILKFRIPYEQLPINVSNQSSAINYILSHYKFKLNGNILPSSESSIQNASYGFVVSVETKFNNESLNQDDPTYDNKIIFEIMDYEDVLPASSTNNEEGNNTNTNQVLSGGEVLLIIISLVLFSALSLYLLKIKRDGQGPRPKKNEGRIFIEQ